MLQQSQQNIYYMTNHLGHVYGVFEQAGERLSQRGYSPYGQLSGDDFTLQSFGMSTKRSDFESGLVSFGYRFYMPNLGRWLNRDPLQEQGGINLYAYVNGDPLGYVDPDGRSPMAFGAVAGGLLAGPPGAVVGGVVGATAGVALCELTDLCDWNESGESEFPALGKPGEDDGFIPPKKPPKNCDPSGRVKNPNGSGKCWEDHIGEVWVPAGGKADHGEDH